jgi:hypothetical protein
MVNADERLAHRLAILAEVAEMNVADFCTHALRVTSDKLWAAEYETFQTKVTPPASTGTTGKLLQWRPRGDIR